MPYGKEKEREIHNQPSTFKSPQTAFAVFVASVITHLLLNGKGACDVRLDVLGPDIQGVGSGGLLDGLGGEVTA